MVISLLAEGHLEIAAATRVLKFCGHEIGTVFGTKGCNYIKEKAAVFNNYATSQTGMLVLTDFRDSGEDCILTALNEYVYKKYPFPSDTYLFCFSIYELESWLLADNSGFAKFMNVAVSNIPLDPESDNDPKKTIVNIARKSKTRSIREGVAPPPGHRAKVGPEYFSLMSEFIMYHWNIENAIKRAPSLEWCVNKLKKMD